MPVAHHHAAAALEAAGERALRSRSNCCPALGLPLPGQAQDPSPDPPSPWSPGDRHLQGAMLIVLLPLRHWASVTGEETEQSTGGRGGET